MLLRTHLVFSILIGVLIFDYLDSPFLFLAFLLFATIIIDIDSRKSFIGKRWYFRPLQWFFNHRGIFHTFIFGFVLSAILFFISANAGFGFFIGYLSHLLLDLFTKQGIMLFYPLTNLRIGFGIRSGGLIEEIFFVLLLLTDILLIVLKLVF